MSISQATKSSSDVVDDGFVRQILDLHFHPTHGTRFWLRRQQSLDFDVRDRIRAVADLELIGTIEPKELRGLSVWELVPQSFHRQRDQFVLAESGGTSGVPIPTAYLKNEFREAFVTPFVEAAESVGFPRGAQWLFVGPSGPHIIGRAALELVGAFGGGEPWFVDFDPRWAKKLASGSMAASRYREHVVEQAIAVFDREPIDVLFATPPVLDRLIERLTDAQRRRLRGIHHGGLAMTPQQLNVFREAFPDAVHLSGYGNTLFGCALEVEDRPRDALDYFPRGPRMWFDVVTTDGEASDRGQLVFHRLDQSMLLVGVRERDWVQLIPASQSARQLGWFGNGIRNPCPPPLRTNQFNVGLY